VNLTGGVYYAFNSSLDIAIVIDGTLSSEWSTIRRFLTTFGDRFYVGPTLTRFAVVQFTQRPTTTFGFTRYSTNAQLRNGFSNLQQTATGNVRNLAEALNYTHSNVFSQSRNYAAQVYSFYNT